MHRTSTRSSNQEAAPIRPIITIVHHLLDRLLHAHHRVPAPVEEDVGGGVLLGTRHQLLRRGLDNAVVTVEP